MAWAKGTDSATKVKTELAAWLKTYLSGRSGIDKRLSIDVPEKERKRQPAPSVRIYTGPDEQEPREIHASYGNVIAEWHRVTFDVIGDERATTESALNAIVSCIRQGLNNPTERAKLITKGVCNIRSSADALDVTNVVYERPVTIICSTETLV